MRALALGLLAGLLWLQSRSALPGWPALIALLLTSAVFLACAVRYSNKSAYLNVWLWLCAGASFGIAWAGMLAHHRLNDRLDPALEGRDLIVTGEVRGLPDIGAMGQRFRFQAEHAQLTDGSVIHVPAGLSLGWYGRRGESKSESESESESSPVLHSGERWQLTVRLKRPHGLSNPGGFDAEAWLLNENLRATGYVRAADNHLLGDAGWSFHWPLTKIDRLRARIRDKINATLPDHPYAGVIVALTIGDQRAVEPQEWQVFNRTGIGHLISISGLHITMISGLFAALFGWLWRHSFFTRASLPLLCPVQKASAAAGWLAALAYVALAGFGIPAQRTLLMLAVVCIALWSSRALAVSQILCAALLVVLVCDPWAVLWPGFWLSFVAIACILYASPAHAAAVIGPMERSALSTQLIAAARTQWIVTAGLLPLSLAWFSQVSLISPLANAVAIPLVSFLVTPLSLLGVVLPQPLSGWLLPGAHALLDWLAHWLAMLSSSALAVWQAPQPGWCEFALAMLGTVWALGPRGWPLRWLGLLTWLPLLLAEPDAPRKGFQMTAFDIGQGNALLIETAHHRLMYDSGPAFSEDSDGGSRVLLPYLRSRGIASLDALIISHSDTDHSGGARSLWEGIQTGWLSSSLAPNHRLLERSPPHWPCHAGQSWTWDGVRFEMLHPLPNHWQQAALPPNARSCTLRISYGEHAVLLTGDIEAPQERALLERTGETLKSDVLLAPHHGSGTSSTLPFLQAVAPSLAVFQVGYRNRYRHPKAEVWDRYRSLGIPGVRTDQSGAVRITVDEGLRVERYRCERARYWYSEVCLEMDQGARVKMDPGLRRDDD